MHLGVNLVLLFFCTTVVHGIYLCDNFQSYYYLNDKHCYYKDLDKNVTEVVRGWGFTVEEYSVKTEDGYILTVIRLYDKITQKKPLVFAHSEMQNSMRFVIRYKKSFAYHFGKMGYDIYLINFRGTTYSNKHETKSCEDTHYWDFSFYQLGFYDLCAVLKLVKTKSKEKPIYIGDATGATAGLVYASSKPEKAADHLTGMILYAPLAYMENVKSYFKLFSMIIPNSKSFLDQVLNGRTPRNIIAELNCDHYPYQMYICEFIKSLFYGDDFSAMDPSDLPLTYHINVESVSTTMLTHYSQLMQCGKFMQYDFGLKKNYQVYGSPKPLPYNTSAISIPVKIFFGKNDWLSTPENIQLLYNSLPQSIKCGMTPIACDKFNHVDFQQHKDIEKLVFEPTTEVINKFEAGTGQA